MSDSPDRPERLADILRELVSLTRKADFNQPESEETDSATETEKQTAAPRSGTNLA